MQNKRSAIIVGIIVLAIAAIIIGLFIVKAGNTSTNNQTHTSKPADIKPTE